MNDWKLRASETFEINARMVFQNIYIYIYFFFFFLLEVFKQKLRYRWCGLFSHRVAVITYDISNL